MSTSYDDDLEQEDLETPEPQQSDSPNIRQLRDKSKRYDKLLVEHEAVTRKLALHESGVDFTSPQGQMFRDMYSGPADADQVRESAKRYGLIPELSADEQQMANELRQQQTVSQVAASGEAMSVGTRITHEEFNDTDKWSRAERFRFKATHPDLWERLKTPGAHVDRPAGF